MNAEDYVNAALEKFGLSDATVGGTVTLAMARLIAQGAAQRALDDAPIPFEITDYDIRAEALKRAVEICADNFPASREFASVAIIARDDFEPYLRGTTSEQRDAKVWDEGFRAGNTLVDGTESVNPYRKE